MPLKPRNKTEGGKIIRTAAPDQHHDFQIQENARPEKLKISI